ncbi:response regulator transcription factor [Williamsia muralis]|jgi:DNA-binding NarL/FixJ family response regulator|uniref:LuxR family two component transcriptional regulator n=1 Tax=Williamsia marianensis TaxID=85044 RepID=A0A495K5N5_WILMA|nr:response regulator transcription factor [Williamsia muralis]RKR95702.1 LuxR family two component transcriptional regulator [Williamsia muralis]
MIRVVIADDHAAIRAGLRLMLDGVNDIEVVGEAVDGDDAVRLVAELHPDVVLMDIRMPGTDGIAATALIGATHDANVLILTTFDIDDYLFAALRAGAAGFMLKTATATELVSAVTAVARGDAALAPEVTRRVIERFTDHPSPRPPAEPDRVVARGLAELTERERDVLAALGRGLSNAQIASELFIGETTVKTHVSRVLTKLGLQSRVQAAIIAREHGVVRPDGTR